MNDNPIIEDFKVKSKNYYSDIYIKGKDPKRIVRIEETDNILRRFKIKGKKILDAGSGPAVLYDLIKHHEGEYYAIDLSPDNINEAKSRIPGVNAFVGSLQKTHFNNFSFDFVVSLGCLEYIKDIGDVVKEFSRITSKGGIVISSFANKKSPSRIWEEYIIMPLYRIKKLIKREKTYRRYLRTEKYMNILFETNDFRKISVHYINFSIFGYPFTSIKFFNHLNKILGAQKLSRYSSEFISIYIKQ